MSRLRFRIIQAIMGIVVICFAFLGWMAVAPFSDASAASSAKAASGDDWKKANPLASPGAGPAAAGGGLDFLSLPVPAGFTQELEARVVSMPRTAEAFRSLRDSAARTPEGGAILFVLALNAYAEDKAFGETCVTMMLANDPVFVERSEPGAWLGYSPSKHSEYLLKRLSSYAGIARSYVRGTKLDDDYALPPLPWAIRVARNKYSALENGDVKVFVFSTGADSRRPVEMRKNDQGVWKVAGFSSLPMPVKTPPPRDPL